MLKQNSSSLPSVSSLLAEHIMGKKTESFQIPMTVLLSFSFIKRLHRYQEGRCFYHWPGKLDTIKQENDHMIYFIWVIPGCFGYTQISSVTQSLNNDMMSLGMIKQFTQICNEPLTEGFGDEHALTWKIYHQNDIEILVVHVTASLW